MDRGTFLSCRIDTGEISSPEKEKLLKILSMKTIAVVGMSPKKDRPSNYVPRYMKEKGYRIIPVRPGIKSILGERCYRDLEEIEEPVEIVNVFRRSEFCPEIAEKAVKIGAKALWLQEGIVSEEAKKIAEDAGLLVVMDKCMQKIHATLEEELNG